MILVYLTIDGGLKVLVLCLGDVFLLNSWVHGLLLLVGEKYQIGEKRTSWTAVSCFPSLERKLPTAAFALSILMILFKNWM